MNAASLFILLVISIPLSGQVDAVRQKNFNTKKNVALDGYDPVSYFNGGPVEGESELLYTYKSISYLFSNQGNLAKFRASPEKYEPAYGGWCAFAMGETGEKIKVDPETFKIIDGKLYLFYNFWGNNTLKEWNTKEKKLKEAGDRNWRKIVP